MTNSTVDYAREDMKGTRHLKGCRHDKIGSGLTNGEEIYKEGKSAWWGSYVGHPGTLDRLAFDKIGTSEEILNLEMLSALKGDISALKAILPFTSNRKFQLVEDRKFHSTKKLDSILGRGNYEYAVIVGPDCSKKFYVRVTMKAS